MKRIIEKIFKCLVPVPVLAFVFWKLTNFNDGKYYDEVYFLTITLSISMSFLYIYYNIEGLWHRLACYTTSTFYGCLFLGYIYYWIFKGEPLADYIMAAIVGFVLTILRSLYDIYKRYAKHRL